MRILTIGSVWGENEMLLVKEVWGVFQVKKHDIIQGWVQALGDAVIRKLLGSHSLAEQPF